MEYKKCTGKPCKECPFRTNAAPGWLGSWKSPLSLHQFVMGEQPFPCHMTMLDQDEELKDKSEMVLCTGAILYASNNAKMFRDPALAAEQRAMKNADRSGIMDAQQFLTRHAKKG